MTFDAGNHSHMAREGAFTELVLTEVGFGEEIRTGGSRPAGLDLNITQRASLNAAYKIPQMIMPDYASQS